MDFYERIRTNKRGSYLLMFVCVALLVVTVYFIGAAMGNPVAGVVAGLICAFFLTFISYFAGDSIILAVSGAREIKHGDNPRLFNVVEEMSIAAGVPAPRVFVIEDSAPNAFATGRSPQKSAVAITTGLMDKLNREELQGVMAHELSHIRNFDIRFAMLMAVMVGVIAMMCDFFRRYVFWGSGRRRSSSKGGGAQALFILIALVLAIVAPIFAKLIQLAVSRQREYLADASAAELTRNPIGLASALAKIANDKEVLEVANRATQHLYIVNPIKPFEERAAFLFSTHPPITERIRRLKEMTGAYSQQ